MGQRGWHQQVAEFGLRRQEKTGAGLENTESEYASRGEEHDVKMARLK